MRFEAGALMAYLLSNCRGRLPKGSHAQLEERDQDKLSQSSVGLPGEPSDTTQQLWLILERFSLDLCRSNPMRGGVMIFGPCQPWTVHVRLSSRAVG